MILHLGDCLDVMAGIEEGAIDAVVTDPPYGISFMDKHWDSFAIKKRVGKRDVSKLGTRLTGGVDTPNRKETARTASAFANAAGAAGGYDFSLKGNRAFQAWVEEWGVELLRVLKPGGHAMVFGGTRTYHRLAAGLEDAGFEIRDCIAWMFGQGFPKSLNLGGDWEGWGTALKPAFEPIVVARKPLVGTVAANVAAYGAGALNIDACRIEGAKGDGNWAGRDLGDSAWFIADQRDAEPGAANGLGRWPANVVLDVDAAALLDEQTGVLTSGANATRQRQVPQRIRRLCRTAGMHARPRRRVRWRIPVLLLREGLQRRAARRTPGRHRERPPDGQADRPHALAAQTRCSPRCRRA